MDPNEQLRQALHQAGPGVFMFICIVFLIRVVLYIIPMWQIANKAGISGAISLLAIIPFIGRLLVLYILAFSDWKVGPIPAIYPPTFRPPPPVYPPQGPAI
jgi:hypothetical protein